MKISFTTQIYNEDKQKILGLIKSVYNHVCEVIVIDDGSEKEQDELKSEVEKLPKTKYFYRDRSGFDKHHNCAKKLASGDWILRLDADERIRETDLQRMKGLVEKADKEGYDGIECLMKDYVDGKFIRDQFKRRIFENALHIRHPGKIHTEEVGFQKVLKVHDFIIYHERTKEDVLESTELFLKELKPCLDAFELIWHRTREVGLGDELDELLKKVEINVKI